MRDLWVTFGSTAGAAPALSRISVGRTFFVLGFGAHCVCSCVKLNASDRSSTSILDNMYFSENVTPDNGIVPQHVINCIENGNDRPMPAGRYVRSTLKTEILALHNSALSCPG